MEEKMQKILGNNITLTRGDTFKANVDLFNRDGTAYTPEQGDAIRFALKKDYGDAEPILNISIPNDTRLLHIEPNDTKTLPFGNYVYDIEITKADGTVDTFIAEAVFNIAPEVH